MTKRLFLVLLLVPILGACATKRDLRDLQTEISAMQAEQEDRMLDLERQHRELMDALQSHDTQVRGDLANQVVRLERQLVQIQELTGQSQQQLEAWRNQLREAEEAARQRAAQPSPFDPGETGGGDPEALFNTASSALSRGSVASARAGFEAFLTEYPDHRLAPEAQLHIGDSYFSDDDPEAALDAYAAVLELYPDDPAAPTALFRAALIERDRGNDDRAEAMFRQVIESYPDSPEAEQAEEEIG